MTINHYSLQKALERLHDRSINSVAIGKRNAAVESGKNDRIYNGASECDLEKAQARAVFGEAHPSRRVTHPRRAQAVAAGKNTPDC